MSEIKFYKHPDGTRDEMCKDCLCAHVDSFDPTTFLWIIERFDVPYIPSEWNKLRDKTFPRINTILIVISIQEQRLDKSIQECIKEICKLFPLADFWNHVIIIYTHFNGTENQKRRLKQKGEAFINDFFELTKIINRENSIQINPPINGIKMVFNEYDATETDEEIIKLNLEETERNINKIINYMKDMRPIYSSLRLLGQKDILLSRETVGKFTIIKYKKVNIIEYEDFKFDNCPPEKIEYEEKISEYNIKREDTETDFILCESESSQDKKVIKDIKNIFIIIWKNK
jgi:hypothetical protein